ncbi:MAG: hypothetical protein ABH811_00355 [archaeon]
MKNKINKRGDIPVTILVIGVFAVCTLAILSFKFFDIKTNEDFYKIIGASEEMNTQIQKYYFYDNVEVSEGNIEKFLNIQNGFLEIEKKNKDKIIVKIEIPVSGLK